MGGTMCGEPEVAASREAVMEAGEEKDVRKSRW